MVIWFFRRRPPLWVRIARVSLIVGSTAAAAFGAELLRRRLGGAAPRVEMTRSRQGTRVRVSIPRSKAGRRKRPAVVTGS